MKRYFNDLIDILTKEVQLYTELKRIEDNKKNIIISNDVKALDAITKKEQGFVKTIVQLESLRTQAVDGLCKERGIGKVSQMSDLYAHLNPFEIQQLQVNENKLKTTIDEIQEVNQMNEKLIKQSLEYIEFSVNLMKQFGMEEAGYGDGAKHKEVKASKGLFDAKV